MAYATVLSLNQTLEHISNPHPGPEQYETPLQDQQIKSLQEKLNSLLEFMDHSWQRRSDEVRCLEREIRDAAYKAEDMIDWHISKNFGQEGFQERQLRDQTFRENFEIVADEIDSINTKAAKLKELWGATDLHQSQRTSSPAGPSKHTSSGKNAMVGFQNDLDQIKDQLTGNQATLQIIQVTGMGGIGKTTLATNVYNDPLIEYHFHTRAWVSISQEYREREVLLSLLDSMKQLNAEMRQQNNTEKLKECLYKSLKGRRYLVVMDDVWNSEAWDSLRMIFPDDRNGSRIMFTTRQSIAVDSHISPHRMQFLNETGSWNLLRQKVFGEDCCPLELEKAGKEIAKNCRGLPLSLVVMGGHLSKANRTKDYWERVAENVKSVVNATDASCFEILSLSYDYLPPYLKACFLYMGVFPEDAKIRVSRLIKLWVAEGFLKPVRGRTLEEVAEEYLGDLISRNLILFSQKSSRGKIKTCSIHDLLRDLCIRKAQEEKFFHVTDKDVKIFAESTKQSRRLCIHPDIFPKVLSNSDNSNANLSLESLPPVRSILSCSSNGKHFILGNIYESGDRKKFPLLRVLDLAKGQVEDFPTGEIKLVHSRYLAFSWRFSVQPKIIPDFLWYLQTLILNCDIIYLPKEIWRMSQLRHLLFRYGECYLPCPTRSPIDGKNLVLGNLLTLSRVSTSSCKKKIFKRVPNLKKLGISVGRTPFSLGNLVDLTQLETLKISGIDKSVGIQMNFSFPNIKKLALCRCKIAWKDMSVVGLMPSLEVLKLWYCRFDGPEWEPNEGEFCKLKYLLLDCINLVQWRSNNTHFRSLERLILRECFELEEIPYSIGEIPTLQSIDLDDASPSAVTSAMQIQEEQKDLGNDSLQVHVLHTFQEIHRATEEPEAEIIAKVWSNVETLQLEATTLIHRFFLYKSISSIDEKVIYRVLPRFFEFLYRNDYPHLQREAARAITSIASHSSDNIDILIDHGVIPILVNLLSSPKDFLRDQALLALGNLARDSRKSRDLVLSCGVLMPILEQFNDKPKLSVVRKATQTLSEFCLYGPWPRFEQVKSSLLHLAQLIHIDDEEVLEYACLSLSNLFRTKDIIQVVIDAGVFPRLIELLLYQSSFVPLYALYAVDNIISNGNDIQFQDIIDNGVLPCLINLLTKNYGNKVKVATCSVVTSIIQRTGDHIQAVIEAGIISPFIELLQNAEFDVQEMAACTIFRAIAKGTNEQIKFFVHEGCIKPMCDLLVSSNVENYVIRFCLFSLKNILKVGEAEKNQGNTDTVNVFAQMIDVAGGLHNIKNLQTHKDSKICVISMRILETYWREEDDNEEDSEDDNDEETEDEDEWMIYSDNDNVNDNEEDYESEEDDNDEDSDAKPNTLS